MVTMERYGTAHGFQGILTVEYLKKNQKNLKNGAF